MSVDKSVARRSGILGSLLLLCSGCTEDVNRLARAGAEVSQRLSQVSRPGRDRLSQGYRVLSGDLRGGSVRERVAYRLQLEQSLAEQTIEIEVVEGVVILRGTVAQSADKARAVDLARTTVGVEQVRDELTTTR